MQDFTPVLNCCLPFKWPMTKKLRITFTSETHSLHYSLFLCCSAHSPKENFAFSHKLVLPVAWFGTLYICCHIFCLGNNIHFHFSTKQQQLSKIKSAVLWYPPFPRIEYNYNWPALQLVWLAQWILSTVSVTVIKKIRVQFLIKSEFFLVLFQLFRLLILLRRGWHPHSIKYINWPVDITSQNAYR